ncbi:MAG: patatin-like phospholipase family protein, partial [Nevskiaceae bacterium]|nr:patatin-like phospholipase family protein [Nevskiaceae bacterium]
MRKSALLCALLIAAFAGPVTAASDASPAEAPRPRVGLVLSGGGARGAAHVGVLKVLEQMRVPIDAIAGTSMGAVVGGLYASGMDARQIEREFLSIDWQDALSDRPSRENMSFRRREEDHEYLVRFPLGWRDGDFQLPKGFIQGQKLQQMLRLLTARVAQVEDFDHLPTRFRAVATDLETGQPKVLSDGDLVTALRASLAAPGVFTPVEREGQLLVDGGVSNNLPIDVVRTMDVDVLIVVDVGLPLSSRDRLGSVTSVSNQMLVILMRRDSQRQRDTLGRDDIVIDPSMESFSSFDFTRLPRAIEYGQTAAQGMQAQLARLSLNQADYDRYLASRTGREAPAGGTVQFVRADADSQQFSEPISVLFRDLVGLAYDPREVDRYIRRLYGQGTLESLDYTIEPATDAADQIGLTFNARAKSWGPNYLRFGLSLQDDFQGNSTYDATAHLTMTDLNHNGAEWLWDGQIGNSPHLSTEFYLPFSPLQRWFLLPSAAFQVRNLPLGIDLKEAGRLHVNSFDLGLAGGRAMGSATEMRAGIQFDNGSTRTRLEGVQSPSESFRTREYFLRYVVDDLNDLAFPQRGGGLTLEWRRYEDSAFDYAPADTLAFDWRQFVSWGRNRAALWLSAGATWNDDVLAERNQFRLGGFLNLSGLPRDVLSGANYGIARLIYFRQVGQGGEGIFGMPMYVGMSVEAGDVWGTRREFGSTRPRTDASVFLGLDSFLGPAYLSYGYDSAGHTALFLSLG